MPVRLMLVCRACVVRVWSTVSSIFLRSFIGVIGVRSVSPSHHIHGPGMGTSHTTRELSDSCDAFWCIDLSLPWELVAFETQNI